MCVCVCRLPFENNATVYLLYICNKFLIKNLYDDPNIKKPISLCYIFLNFYSLDYLNKIE